MSSSESKNDSKDAKSASSSSSSSGSTAVVAKSGGNGGGACCSSASKCTAANCTTVFVKFLESTDGRDKGAKSVQFGARLLAYYVAGTDAALATKLSALSGGVGEGRKLFRFFKGVANVQKASQALSNAKMPTHIKALTVAQHAGFFNFWLWDHLLILTKWKAIQADSKDFAKNSGLGFFVGTLTGLVLDFLSYSETIEAIRKLPREPGSGEDERKALRAKQFQLTTNIIGKVGDLVVSASLAQLDQRFLGQKLPEPLVALGGLAAGLIAAYWNWKAAQSAVSK